MTEAETSHLQAATPDSITLTREAVAYDRGYADGLAEGGDGPMSKLTPYCKTCGGIYNCSCLTPREDRLARAEAQVAALREALVDASSQVWAVCLHCAGEAGITCCCYSGKPQGAKCLSAIVWELATSALADTAAAAQAHDKRVSAAAYARGVEDAEKGARG